MDTPDRGHADLVRDDEDPLLKARIDRSLAPYIGLLPREDLAQIRETLTIIIGTHP